MDRDKLIYILWYSGADTCLEASVDIPPGASIDIPPGAGIDTIIDRGIDTALDRGVDLPPMNKC